MKTLVIGYGSIGSRHYRLLSELGCDVRVLSKHNLGMKNCFFDLSQALSWEPEYIIIANETAKHYQTLQSLFNNQYKNGIILVEKPLFNQLEVLPKVQLSHVFVAYNLRFHPILQEIKKAIQTEKIISAQIYVGQYLPEWRPDKDYRKSYSAEKALGGGVLRDLSHELDYMNWFFGEFS